MDVEQFTKHRTTGRTAEGPFSYVEVGEGPPALFVHGVFLNGYLWHDVLDGVRDLRRCIAVDLPAHGATPATDDLSVAGLAAWLVGACDALGLDTVDVVANDTGGAVAQVFAARHPQRVRTLTLTNCDTADNLPPAAFQAVVDLARGGQLAPAVQGLAADPELARSPAGLGSGYQHPERLPDEAIAAYLAPFAEPDRARDLERCVAALDAGDLRAVQDGLRRLDVPTAIVWGTGDAFFPVGEAHGLRDLIPGATEVVEVDGATLFVPDERAAELVAPLRRLWGG
jgi:pimeloyl-ACP methyl ester carboxylesterase